MDIFGPSAENFRSPRCSSTAHSSVAYTGKRTGWFQKLPFPGQYHGIGKADRHRRGRVRRVRIRTMPEPVGGLAPSSQDTRRAPGPRTAASVRNGGSMNCPKQGVRWQMFAHDADLCWSEGCMPVCARWSLPYCVVGFFLLDQEFDHRTSTEQRRTRQGQLETTDKQSLDQRGCDGGPFPMWCASTLRRLRGRETEPGTPGMRKGRGGS